ncbi:major facilitator superfamily domain-containing protein [Mycena epipterygia]|nr:major facilitator superfamily domain-containing protein [Mycena epipterygia]
MSAHDSATLLDVSYGIELESRTSAFNSTIFASEPVQNAGQTTESADADPALVSNNSNGRVNESALPPVDSGFGAWSFLAAAFFVEIIVWGFPNAYGVFLDAYLQDPRYASQKNAASLLPLIGTLSTGVLYCSAGALNSIAARYPHLRRKSMWFGAALFCGGLLGASYATKIYQLILLQGILSPLGGGFLYLPCMSYMTEWFVARRGTANGILFAGTAAGGLVIPLVLTPLISKYGSFKALRIFATAFAILLVVLLPFVKGRLPQARIHGPVPRGAVTDWMRQKSFWVILAVNTFQSFAHFIPIVYLPTFANDLHISTSNSAVTLAVLNAASFVGSLSMGYLSDKLNPWVLAFSTLLATSATTFILWGILAHSFGGLLAFGVVYGGVAGSWTSLWTGFVRPLTQNDPAASATVYGYLLLSRGVGSFVSTPISARLYAQPRNATGGPESTGFDVGDGRFGKMIVYVGTCFAGAAGVAALGWAMDLRKTHRGSRDAEGDAR